MLSGPKFIVEFQKLLLALRLTVTGAGAPALEPPPEGGSHRPVRRGCPLGQRGARGPENGALAARTVELEGLGAAG